MYCKDVKYKVNEEKGIIEIYIYSERYKDWINLGEIAMATEGQLIIYFFGDGNSDFLAHFTYFDQAEEVENDIRQFIHCDFKIVNDPNNFHELINSWKLMSEINYKVN